MKPSPARPPRFAVAPEMIRVLGNEPAPIYGDTFGGAGFSATIGYLGMWLATRANVRVAAAANTEGREKAQHGH